MSEQSSSEKDKDQSPSTEGVPLKSGGEVVVSYLASPPPAGKKTIHPRRLAPKVPDREEKTEK